MKTHTLPEAFYADKEKLLTKLIRHLVDETKLPIEEYDYTYRHHSTCFVDGEEGLSIRIKSYAFLSDIDKKNITNAFPVTICESDSCLEFELLTIFDFDFDDERWWYPSIGMRVTDVK